MVKVVTDWLQAGFLKLILSVFQDKWSIRVWLTILWEGNIVVWAGVDLELRHLCREQRATGR